MNMFLISNLNLKSIYALKRQCNAVQKVQYLEFEVKEAAMKILDKVQHSSSVQYFSKCTCLFYRAGQKTCSARPDYGKEKH